jgi:hypothetical protein
MDTTVKCFIAWYNNPRRQIIMGARLSSTAKFCREAKSMLDSGEL